MEEIKEKKVKKEKKKSSSKVMDVLRTVLVVVVVTLAVLMLIFTLVTRIVGKNDADIFGYQMFIVKSDSMAKTHFASGDIIISKKVDPTSLKEGDIITFWDPTVKGDSKKDINERIITHMIKRPELTDNGERGFKTYGTTKGVEDSFVVPYSHIIGEYQFKIPYGGWFLQFFRTIPGYICCILVPFLILLLSQGISFVRTIVLYRKEQNAIIAEERAKLNEEKAQAEQEAQNMMAELEMLRRKLMEQGAGAAEVPEMPFTVIEESASEEIIPDSEIVTEEIASEVPTEEANNVNAEQ